MSPQLDALRASVARLRTFVNDLDPADVERSAYPTEWSVADVLSHLGSQAEIGGASLRAALDGVERDPDANQPVWDAWNAKAPAEKARDFLVADQAMIDLVDGLSSADAQRVNLTIGPMQVDLTRYLGLRLNEHTLHSWDVMVAFDPRATLAPDATELVIDNIAMLVGFTAKPTGRSAVVGVRTTGAERDLHLRFEPDSVSLVPAVDGVEVTAELVMPAEAFIRLVYGRLDPDHTPAVKGDADLDELRSVFPGF